MATIIKATASNFLIAEKVIKSKVFAELNRKQRRKAEKKATKHYRNAVSEVKANIKHGFASPESGGSRKIKTRDGNDKSLTYTTGKWPALTDDYRKRKIKSHRIWSKNRVLTKAVNQAVGTGSLKVTSHAFPVKHTAKEKKKGRRKVRMRYMLEFPNTGSGAFTALMTRPFVEASASAVSGFTARNIDRGSANIMWYPEMAKRLNRPSKEGKKRGAVNRPWIAGLSGQLGSRMHQAIRKL